LTLAVVGFDLRGRPIVRKELDVKSAEMVLRSFDSVDIQRVDADSSALVGLAGRYQLSAYDAACLWLAAELKAPLATFDRRLGDAARTHLETLV